MRRLRLLETHVFHFPLLISTKTDRLRPGFRVEDMFHHRRLARLRRPHRRARACGETMWSLRPQSEEHPRSPRRPRSRALEHIEQLRDDEDRRRLMTTRCMAADRREDRAAF